nr:MAG TPA: hypothetical protein [Caudoviricetes sp.]
MPFCDFLVNVLLTKEFFYCKRLFRTLILALRKDIYL